MSVSIAIQAHPDRASWVDELRAQLGDVAIAWAQPPFATPEDHRPIWRTKRAALDMHTDAPFHCVLQDDAVLGPSFLERLEQIVADGGDHVVYMLFYRHKRTWPKAVRRATAAGDGHFLIRGMMLGVGIVIPSALIEDLVAFCDGLDLGPRAGDDDLMKVWLRDRRIDTYVPLPSLVDHRPDSASTIGHPAGRRAWRFA